MSKIDYEKNVVRKPLYEAFGGTKNRQSPTMTMISNKQIPGCNYYMEPGWIYGIPDPNPSLHEHVHDFDEIVIHMGGDYKIPRVLGGEVEFYVGGQPVVFNTSTAFYLPKGTPHGPVIWKKFQFPHLQMAIMCGTGTAGEAWGASGIHDSKDILPRKTTDFDYERYAVRSPIYEKGADGALTYMSSLQMPGVKYHIEYGWMTEQTATRVEHIKEMTHKDADEIILNLGNDSTNPEDLGAEMEFSLGGQVLTLSTTSTLFVPRGVKHRPLRYKKFRQPHIFVAIMCGVGASN